MKLKFIGIEWNEIDLIEAQPGLELTELRLTSWIRIDWMKSHSGLGLTGLNPNPDWN